MRRIIASLLLALSAILPQPALAMNVWGTDMSDWWWNTAEDGWGVNIAHESDTIFIAFFVYDTGQRAKWYSGALTSTGGYTFTGVMYETTGPWFGGFFNPNAVGRRVAGNATITFPFISTGASLTYTIDGITVAKTLERFTFKVQNLSGQFAGAIVGTATGCATNGAYSNTGTFLVNHFSASRILITASTTGGRTCNYDGTYAQRGRMGSVVGTYSCSGTGGISSGNFNLLEIEVGNAFVARYTASSGACSESGRIGGMRY